MKYLNQLYEEVKREYSCEGYSTEDLDTLVGQAKMPLPECYVEFLSKMGKNAEFLNGLTYTIDELKTIRTDAAVLAGQNIPKLFLKEDDFVFLMNQGYMFMFFNLSEGENPPVYGFAEAVNQQKFEKLCDSLSDFLKKVFKKDRLLLHPLLKHRT